MMEYVAVALGCMINILLHLNDVFTKVDFSWKYFIKENIIVTILNLIVGMAFVFAKAELSTLYPITFFSAFILGISGQSILKSVLNTLDRDKNTAVGVNSNKSEV